MFKKNLKAKHSKTKVAKGQLETKVAIGSLEGESSKNAM